MLKLLIVVAAILGLLWWVGGWLRRSPPAALALSLAEARSILGVDASDGPEAIRRAHRAKMAVHHPDRGGAHGEAARLNAARDIALAAARKGREEP